MENKKRNLEEAVDSLNEECAKLKAAEQMQAVSTIDKAAEQEQALLIKGALEQQLDQHREAHQKQVSHKNTYEGIQLIYPKLSYRFTGGYASG